MRPVDFFGEGDCQAGTTSLIHVKKMNRWFECCEEEKKQRPPTESPANDPTSKEEKELEAGSSVGRGPFSDNDMICKSMAPPTPSPTTTRFLASTSIPRLVLIARFFAGGMAGCAAILYATHF